MEPFSAPSYRHNRQRCKGNEMPCAHCGKGCVKPWKLAVRVVEGGARYATKDEVEGRVAVDEGGDMGCWPVGGGCAVKLENAGVYVFTQEETSQ